MSRLTSSDQVLGLSTKYQESDISKSRNVHVVLATSLEIRI